MIKRVKYWIVPLLSVLATSAFPVLFLYCSNAAEARFSEVLLPLGVFCGIGLVTLVICSLFMRSGVKAAVAACLFMLVFANYALIESVIQRFFTQAQYWHVLPTLGIIWLHAAHLIWKKLSQDVCQDIVSVLAVVMCGLLVFNGITSLPDAMDRVKMQNELRSQQKTDAQTAATISEDMPNVYLLLFDEYAGFKQIEKYYGFDNAPLRNYLVKNNFAISKDTYNESVRTVTILTNLVNLEYIVDKDVSDTEKEVLRKNGRLYEIFREHGYQVQVAESEDFLGQESPIRNQANKAAVTISGEDLNYLCWQKTPMYPFNHINTSEILQAELNVVEYLEDPMNIPQTPTFTFGYVNLPHQPLMVDENGNAVPVSEYYNWRDDRYYLGQFKYTTKLMFRVIDTILEHDPDSVIMLCSDHGARGGPDEDLFLKKYEREYIVNPLLAVYYRGEPMNEVKGLSTLNAMRRIVTRLFGEEYEILEVPQNADPY